MRSNGSYGGKPRQRPYCLACETARIKNHPSITAGRRKWNAANPDKRRAQKLVESALRNGTMARQPCERCGDPKAHAHHEDYTKPLEVVWLCPRHHKARHREIDAAATLTSVTNGPGTAEMFR